MTITCDQKLLDTQYHDTIATTTGKMPQSCSNKTSENTSINQEVILKATHDTTASCYHEIENSCNFDTWTTETSLDIKSLSSNLDFHDYATLETNDEIISSNLNFHDYATLEANATSHSSDDHITGDFNARKFSCQIFMILFYMQLMKQHHPIML